MIKLYTHEPIELPLDSNSQNTSIVYVNFLFTAAGNRGVAVLFELVR